MTTCTLAGAGRFAADVLANSRIVSFGNPVLEDLNREWKPKDAVRVISFNTVRGKPGTCTGIAVGFLAVGDIIEDHPVHGGMRVLLASAGCFHGDRAYVIPAGSVITSIERR